VNNTGKPVGRTPFSPEQGAFDNLFTGNSYFVQIVRLQYNMGSAIVENAVDALLLRH
jgi:hypothetical protein